MATRGQCKLLARAGSGGVMAERMEPRGWVVPPCPAPSGTVQAGVWAWDWELDTPWGAQGAALSGDCVRDGELPGQAVRALGRVPQSDGEPAGEGGLHPGGVWAVSTWTPSPLLTAPNLLGGRRAGFPF